MLAGRGQHTLLRGGCAHAVHLRRQLDDLRLVASDGVHRCHDGLVELRGGVAVGKSMVNAGQGRTWCELGTLGRETAGGMGEWSRASALTVRNS
jgi:hypothetical protein